MPATCSLQSVGAVIERFYGAPVGDLPVHLFGWRVAFLKKQGADVCSVAATPWVEFVVGEMTLRNGPDVSQAVLRRILLAVSST
jgi:transposase